MHVIQIFIVIGLLLVGPALAQQAETLDSEEVQKGHRLAVTVCAICHVAAPDQRFLPELAPPAPSFVSIVERKEFNGLAYAFHDYYPPRFRQSIRDAKP
jgi:mono/diheme cytochrome c family protein